MPRAEMVQCVVIILLSKCFFSSWLTGVREDASDEPFSYHRYFFEHYKHNKHTLMMVTEGSKEGQVCGTQGLRRNLCDSAPVKGDVC